MTFPKTFLTLLITISLFTMCTTDRGTKIESGDLDLSVYYTDEISAQQAQSVLAYLESLEIRDGDFQVTKNESVYILKIPVTEGSANDPSTIVQAQSISNTVSYEIFNGQPVDVHLCKAGSFKTQKKVEYWSFGQHMALKSKSAHLYYSLEITDDEAKKFAEYVDPDGDMLGMVFQLAKKNDVYIVRTPTLEETENDDEVLSIFKDVAIEISTDVFNKMPVEMHMCNMKFETIKIVSSTD